MSFESSVCHQIICGLGIQLYVAGFSSFSLMRFIVSDFYKSLASFQACISQGRLLTDTSDHCRQSGNLSMILQPVREAVSYRGLFTAGWFGVREKHCSRLEIYDRLRASEQADSTCIDGRWNHINISRWGDYWTIAQRPCLLPPNKKLIYSQLISVALNLFLHLLQS